MTAHAMGDRPLNRIFAQARAGRMLCLAAAVLALGWATAGPADAATGTAAFTSPGQYSFVVPPGVNSATVIAVGAAGGSCQGGFGSFLGGRGAAVTTMVTVSPGERLFVGVGAPGGPCRGGSGSAGGDGGGGAGGTATAGDGIGGAAGGGASLVGLASGSPGFPGLLVVAGAGGGAGFGANGGDAGSAGAGDGGGPGTSTAGGNGGSGQQANGAGGLFGIGGNGGGGCIGPWPGGGGGGGYFGGGGSGCDGNIMPGGGGGGSSFVVPGGTVIIPATPTTDPAGVSITYPAPTAEESTEAISFADQTPGTASPEKALKVTNKGSAPLLVSGVLLGGADPDDFLVSDRCQQAVAPGSSCEVGVRFDPQASGARSASLTLLTNASRVPRAVALTGIGGGVSARAQRPPGNVAVVRCKPSPLKNQGGERGGTPSERCARRVVSGRVKFTAAGAPTPATIARGRVVFAVGASVRGADGASVLVLTERRPLKHGAYALILRHRHGGRWVTRRIAIIIG